MALGSLRTLALELNFSAHGVPATVTPPDEAAIQTRLIWVTPTSELEPVGGAFQGSQPIRIAAFMRSEVPRLPRGTLIAAAEYDGGDEVAWKVDAMDRVEAETHRVIVVPA